ncbi:MAG: DoxX family protein [Mucilaginibacter sp.]
MQVITFIAPILFGGLLYFILKLKAEIVYKLAAGYVLLALLLSVNVWVFYFAGIKNAVVLAILSFIMNWGGALGHLVLGYLSVNIAADSRRLKKMIRTTIWGISILIGNSFIVAAAGKVQYFTEMVSFFSTSGYAIWFLYFIMIAETLGGLGILLHYKLNTGPLAAAGLVLIMFGAVYTHWHNKDPFSDSYAAVCQLANLSLLLVLYYFEKLANHILPPTSIYIV